MVSMFVLYRPGRFFACCALPFISVALLLGLRFIYLVYVFDTVSKGRTYIPSLILLAVCFIIGTLLISLGVIGEILKAQRKIIEECLFLQRREKD